MNALQVAQKSIEVVMKNPGARRLYHAAFEAINNKASAGEFEAWIKIDDDLCEHICTVKAVLIKEGFEVHIGIHHEAWFKFYQHFLISWTPV